MPEDKDKTATLSIPTDINTLLTRGGLAGCIVAICVFVLYPLFQDYRDSVKLQEKEVPRQTELLQELRDQSVETGGSLETATHNQQQMTDTLEEINTTQESIAQTMRTIADDVNDDDKTLDDIFDSVGKLIERAAETPVDASEN